MLHDRPSETAHRSPGRLIHTQSQPTRAQLIISLNFFIGRARTVFDAGFALKTHGSFVNGLTPFFAGLAGFCFSFMLIAPASLKDPDVLSCAVASPMYASTHSFTCLPFRPVDSPTDAYAPVAVIALDFARVAIVAFIDFIVFIGRAIVDNRKHS